MDSQTKLEFQHNSAEEAKANSSAAFGLTITAVHTTLK
jgi:hypothetical protein